MIGFTVIGGYLGAGKTTVLNHLLARADGRRLGVLVNDFGAINIDADLILSRDASTISLTNGCICCSLADGFVEAVDRLVSLDVPPEHIVVEASGVAEVGQLTDYGRLPGLELDGVLVVADAETLLARADDRYVGATVRRQLAAADLVLLNKTDLVSAGSLAASASWLQQQYPGIRLLACQRGEVDVAVLLGAGTRSIRPTGVVAAHPGYVRWHVERPYPATRAQLEGFCAALDASVLRAKGTVGRKDGDGLVLQVVGNRREISVLADAPAGTRLVVIGLEGQLDVARLEQLADTWLS